MIFASLLALLVNAYGTDTLLFYTSGYNTTLQQGLWESFYFERMLSDEFRVTVDDWRSLRRDSLSQNTYNSASNTFQITYEPLSWLSLRTGLRGSRSVTRDFAGNQGYTRLATHGFADAFTETDLLYAHYGLNYGNENSAPSGPQAGWSEDEIMKDNAQLMVKMQACTLGFFHQAENHTDWSEQADTLELSFSRLSIPKGWIAAGADLGRRQSKGYSNIEQYGAGLWVRDTLQLTKRVGVDLRGSYNVDTLTNNLFPTSTHRENKGVLSGEVSYQPFERTDIELEVESENLIHDQADDYYDERSWENSFTGSVSHNFFRRPEQAKGIWGRAVNMISPGTITFSHSLSLHRITTPDSLNALDRDKFSERIRLATTLRSHANLSTNFTLTHYIQKTHYTDTMQASYASNSNERRTSNAAWTVDADFPKILSLTNTANLAFDWTRYYNDSTQNRADRTWRENLYLLLLPDAVLRPGLQATWQRYENWRVVSGALLRSGLKDVFHQRYEVSYVLTRREEAPRWWGKGYLARQWLKITGFVGVKMNLSPADGRNLWQESEFAGLEITGRPWPYLTINGSFLFRRSNYEEPFEASLSVNTGF